VIEPLELLWETPGLPAFDLPEELVELYGGPFGLAEPQVIANFVSTLDGVVAIPSVPGSNKLIAAGSAADRFVMGLLRACADVVVIGSGTFAASPGSVWSAGSASPAAADALADLRARLGRPPELQVVVLTRSGHVDTARPAFEAGAIAVTTDAGAEKLAGRLPAEQILSVGSDLDPAAALKALADRGHLLVLHEGGPTAIGPFLEERLVNELFLTVSPRLTGRIASDPRLALVEGSDLLPGGPLEAHLLSVRRDADHLFLRYELSS
jgi:riboflavin biosynthesis pyrimidine reductase